MPLLYNTHGMLMSVRKTSQMTQKTFKVKNFPLMSMGKSFDLCLKARYSNMKKGPILTLVFDFFYQKLLRKHNVYIFLESTLEQELSCKKNIYTPHPD